MAESRIKVVLHKLKWLKSNKIWPDGLRYLWTDAHGICVLLSLYHKTQERAFLDDAKAVVKSVDDILGRSRGLRIGEEPDRDGQYFHYLTKWMYALNQLGKIEPEYHEKAISLVKDVHNAFVRTNVGVHWKMKEDLSAPYPGYGFGGLDYYDGYVQYKLLDPSALSHEIGEMYGLIQRNYKRFSCQQDLGLGECLWMSHFFPDEIWAKVLKDRSLQTLDTMWVDTSSDSGYFCRENGYTNVKYAFTNFGISYGLQAVGEWPGRVDKINNFFHGYKSHDEYDLKAITHVMHLNSLYPGVLVQTQ